MCYPCCCPRRSVSCHGGRGACCPRPCCRPERSRSTCSPRVIFPGEFQKFSDMIPPSFLLKQPQKGEKCKKKSRKKRSDCDDKRNEDNLCEPENCDDTRNEDNLCDPEEQRIPSQPTNTPWSGTNGPWENQMTIDMPPQPQWVCFECPAAICFPTNLPGLPAAGLPTKRSPPFNPCTGQVYQCENQQMMVRNNNGMAQCPPYNQYCQGVNICLSPANLCYQFNPSNYGDGAILNEPNRNQQYYQHDQSADPYYRPPPEDPRSISPQGDNRSIDANRCYQFNPCNFGDGAILNEPNRNQQYYQYDQSADPYYRPAPKDPGSLSPQGDNRSKGQRKEKETRKGNVGQATESRKGSITSQRSQYNQDNYAEGSDKPNRGQTDMDPSSGHVSQRNRSNSRNSREKSIDRRKDPQLKQSVRVAQQNPATGKGVSQYGNRSRSKTRGTQSIEAPRLNNQNQYSSQNPDPRLSPREKSPGNQAPRPTNRSKSVKSRNKTRRDSSARVPHPCKSKTTSPDRALNGNGRSKSLGERNDPSEQRSKNMPESNLNFYPQNVGMSFGPSNQHYIAEYPLPHPIYTTQLESTVGDSGSCRENSYNLASNDRSQLLNRVHRSTNESRSLGDRQMSTYRSKTSKKQPASDAKRSASKKCTPTKPCKSKPTIADILANEISTQPHVLVLKTQNNEKKRRDKIQKSYEVPVTRDKCMCDEQDEDSSIDTLDEASIWSETVNENREARYKDNFDTSFDQRNREARYKDNFDTSLDQRNREARYKENLDTGFDYRNREDRYQENYKEKSQKKTQKKAQQKAQGIDQEIDQEIYQEKALTKHQERALTKPQEKAQEECEEEAVAEAEKLSNSNEAKTSDCPKNCWIRCPIPWSCHCGPCNNPCSGYCGPCGSPCNAPFYYYGNCYNGYRPCCTYRCNPCGVYCYSQPPVRQVSGQASPKPKERSAAGKSTQKRNQGGASERHCILPHPSTRGFSVPRLSTMSGYYPTVPPQFISPYSRH